MTTNEASGNKNKYTELNLIGVSATFQRSLTFIERFATFDATVLVIGETGTGKELAARALHYLSSRCDKPFVAVNCGAVPEHLVESEFFGHVRGAFTDAREARDGLLWAASGGTLFLDEIEAMSLRAQAVLLRFLQEKEYRPVGTNVTKACNARIIVASNCDLFHMAEIGQFRLDLLHRINQLKLDLPPLRQRTGDVPLLAKTFVERLNENFAHEPKVLHPDSLKSLESYEWPGNVRELENMILSEFLMAEGSVIRIREIGQSPVLVRSKGSDQPSAFSASRPPRVIGMQERNGSKGRRADDIGLTVRGLNRQPTSYEDFKEIRGKLVSELELDYLKELLKTCGGNLSLAARLSGRDRSDLCKLCKKYALQRGSFASTADESVAIDQRGNFTPQA